MPVDVSPLAQPVTFRNGLKAKNVFLKVRHAGLRSCGEDETE